MNCFVRAVCFVRSACFSQASAALLLTSFAGSVPAQVPVSSQPLETNQTIRGVTIQLTDIQWSPFDPPNSPLPFFKMFYLKYHVTDKLAPPLPNSKSLLDFVTQVTAVGPNGDLLFSSGSGEERNSSGAATSRSSYWSDIDPRWPGVGVDVDFVDPAAPPRAIGHSGAPITIANIPVPAEFDKVTPIHAEATTVLGTKVIVEKVKVAQAAHQTTFVFRVVPDPAASDLQFRFSTGSKVTDDTGAKLSPHGGGSAGGGDLLDSKSSFNPEISSVVINDVPSPGATTMTLTLDATESSEALKQDRWFRHFHLLIPLKLLDASFRRPFLFLGTVRGKQVTGTLETIIPREKRYLARFTLQDLTHSGMTWKLSAVRGKDETGSPLTGKPYSGTGPYWKTDGSPLGPDENASEVVLGAPGEPNGPYSVAVPKPVQTLTLEADVSAVRDDYSVLDFAKIPIPAPGQVTVLNRIVKDESGARLVLREIGVYSPGHPLPGIIASKAPYAGAIPPSGIVVVLAELPDPKGRSLFDFAVVAANDPLGRHLGREDGLWQFSQIGDTLSRVPATPVDSARVRTIFFRTASAGAATFNLRMGREIITDLNRHETLTFPAVAAPPIK